MRQRVDRSRLMDPKPYNTGQSSFARRESIKEPEYTTLYEQGVDVGDKTLDAASLPVTADNCIDLDAVRARLAAFPPHLSLVALSPASLVTFVNLALAMRLGADTAGYYAVADGDVEGAKATLAMNLVGHLLPVFGQIRKTEGTANVSKVREPPSLTVLDGDGFRSRHSVSTLGVDTRHPASPAEAQGVGAARPAGCRRRAALDRRPGGGHHDLRHRRQRPGRDRGPGRGREQQDLQLPLAAPPPRVLQRQPRL